MENKYAISIENTTYDILGKDTVISYKQNSEIKKATIENLFNIISNDQDWSRNNKYYAWSPSIQLLYSNLDNTVEYGSFDFIYKHETDKEKWEIISEYGEINIVPEDYSCMVERDGKLLEVKPNEINENDTFIPQLEIK